MNMNAVIGEINLVAGYFYSKKDWYYLFDFVVQNVSPVPSLADLISGYWIQTQSGDLLSP